MVSVNIGDKITDAAARPEELNATLTQQMIEVLEEPAQDRVVERAEAARLFYSVPFPGVRYYSF